MGLSIRILAVKNLTQLHVLFAELDASCNIRWSSHDKEKRFYTAASKYQSGSPLDPTQVILQMKVGVYHHTGISTISLPYVSAYTQPLESKCWKPLSFISTSILFQCTFTWITQYIFIIFTGVQYQLDLIFCCLNNHY